jgi:hypothetical protein
VKICPILARECEVCYFDGQRNVHRTQHPEVYLPLNTGDGGGDGDGSSGGGGEGYRKVVHNCYYLHHYCSLNQNYGN